MNRLKTFGYFILFYVLSVLFIRLTAFVSNKVLDDVSDYLYIPTLGLALGVVPLLVGSAKALEVTDNFRRTKIIIIVIYSIIVLLPIALGVMELWVRLASDLPIIEFIDKEDLTNHWLYYFPFGLGMLGMIVKLYREGEFIETYERIKRHL